MRIFTIYALVLGVFSLLLLSSCDKGDDNFKEKEEEPRGPYTTLFVHASEDFTFAIKEDGTLWARGRYYTPWTENDNGYYHLDDHVKSVVMDHWAGSPRKVFMLKDNGEVWLSKTEAPMQTVITGIQPSVYVTNNAQKIVAGRGFVVILKEDATAWAIGVNDSGQFGTGTVERDNIYRVYDENTPLIQIGEQVKDIAAGWSSIYLVKEDGTLWSAGSNTYGKLGYETENDNIRNQLTFRQVEDVTDVVSVTAVANDVMVLRADGEAWSFGSNVSGTQALGSSGQEPTYPHKVADDVKAVFAGSRAAYLIKNDDTLWACGSNRFGQMGADTDDYDRSYQFKQIAEKVEDVTVGEYHAIILQNGYIRMAGDNRENQLSQSDEEQVMSYTEFPMP